MWKTKAFVALLLAVLFGNVDLAADEIRRPAILVLPASVSMGDRLTGFVEFRWNDDNPVILDTWTIHGELCMLTFLSIYDESGKEVQWITPVSLPMMPNGMKVANRNDVIKLGLYTVGWVKFGHPGHYYGIATFSWAKSAGATVKFTTQKRWFDVIDAKPNAT